MTLLRTLRVLLLVAAALAGSGLSRADTALPASDGGEGITFAPRYLLMDPRGRAVTQEDFRGRWQLLSFGYVSCPDVCPTTLLEMKQILGQLGNAAARLQAIFITVDPERDNPSVMREYTAAFDERILGLTGSPELVARATESFRIRVEKVREPGAPPEAYAVNHTAGMVLLDARGIFVARFPYGMNPAETVSRIRSAMAEGTH